MTKNLTRNGKLQLTHDRMPWIACTYIISQYCFTCPVLRKKRPEMGKWYLELVYLSCVTLGHAKFYGIWNNIWFPHVGERKNYYLPQLIYWKPYALNPGSGHWIFCWFTWFIPWLFHFTKEIEMYATALLNLDSNSFEPTAPPTRHFHQDSV